MKAKALLASMLLCAVMAQAQDDPTIMTINGQKVSRSEFEYSYNKNNTDGVIDKKSVDEYVDLFVNYKLKVQAALDAKMDTLPSFKKEFRGYRDQQIRPSFVTDDDVEAEAKLVYENTKKQIGASRMLPSSASTLSTTLSLAEPTLPIWRARCRKTPARHLRAASCRSSVPVSW